MIDCWSLNGKRNFDGRKYYPCNTTAVEAGGHSTCCGTGDLCLTNGMCKDPKTLENNNWYTRQGCTDKSWEDPACPKICGGIEPTRNTGLIFNCQQKESWCCGYVGVDGFRGWPRQDSVNTTCCNIDDLSFKAADPIVYATALSSAAASTKATPSAITVTEYRTTTQIDLSSLPTQRSDELSEDKLQQQESSSGLNTGAKIGLGVGIPLAIIAFVAIGTFFWLRRRRRSAAPKNTPDDSTSSASDKQAGLPYQEIPSVYYRHEAPANSVVAELPGTLQHVTAELPNTEVPAELPSQSKIAK